MSKKTCLTIFAIALITIIASYLLGYSPIIKQSNSIFHEMCNLYVAIPAILLALILLRNKHYWLLMLGLAVVVAIIIQTAILGGALTVLSLIYKIVAFLVYAYLIILIRYILR